MKPIPKSDETRARILNAALVLFRDKGFDQSTIREIAAEAGVATGSAYYYFASKEAMVMAFYQRASDEMQPMLAEALAGSQKLESRLRALIDVKLRYFDPNRAFLGALLRHAADPSHPLSPFSPQTKSIRDADIAVFDRAIEESEIRVAKDLRADLPRLLWLYQMALIFFWLSDRSPGHTRTMRLTDLSLHLVINMIRMASLPLMKPARESILKMIAAVDGTEVKP